MLARIGSRLLHHFILFYFYIKYIPHPSNCFFYALQKFDFQSSILDYQGLGFVIFSNAVILVS